MPTLVIWGEKDPYILTDNLNGLERYVPKLTVERIPDATHWVVHEKSARVNELIRDFLAGFKIDFECLAWRPANEKNIKAACEEFERPRGSDSGGAD